MKGDAHLSARYFTSAAQFRSWLDRHHADTRVLWVGYYKRGTGRPSLTWSESVDVALCYGWIDGVRRPVDEERYAIRFTPRRSKSNWSRVNLAKANELIASDQMHPAGLAAYQGRNPSRTDRYLYEQKQRPGLAPRYLAELRKNPKAWTFYKGSGSLVSAGVGPVCHERRQGGNPPPPAHPADPGLRRRSADHARWREEVSRPAGSNISYNERRDAATIPSRAAERHA